MENPIIILIFWVVINILIKSSRDKKKAEKARNKSGGRPPQQNQADRSQKTKGHGMKDFRQALDDYKAQIEKELNPQKNTKEKAPDYNRTTHQTKKKEKQPMKTYREGRFWEEEQEKEKVPEIKKAPVMETSQSENVRRPAKMFDIKNDILKGVVYSEILDKPKSMKNRRSPF